MKIKELNPIEKELIEQKANSRIKHSKLLGAGNCGAVWKILFEDGTLVCYKKDTQFDRVDKEREKYTKIYKEREGIELIGEKIDMEGIFIPYLGKTVSWKTISAMPDWAKVCLCYEITQALKLAHEQNILYRDLKQDNFVISDEGEALLIDFGRSVYINEDTSLFKGWKAVFYPVRAVQLMMQEQVPPDYYWVNGKVGFWSDIYSLGVIFRKILPGIPGTEMLYQSCLSRNPDERPTLDKISNYLINPLLGDCLSGQQNNKEDFFTMMSQVGSFFKPLNRLSYIEGKSFDQDECQQIKIKLISEIRKSEREILKEIRNKLSSYYRRLETKFLKEYNSCNPYDNNHCKFFLAGKILRIMNERLGYWDDEIIKILFLIKENLEEVISSWQKPKRKYFDEVIELCDKAIPFLISRSVYKNSFAFMDHAVNQDLLIDDADSTSIFEIL